MQISIIIPTLNESDRIAATVSSLRCANSIALEIIVVDGGSTDQTVEVARQHSACVVRAEPGRAAQMNAGAAHASGDLLWFLHADTVPDPDCLRALHSLAQARQGEQFWGRFDVRIDNAAWQFRIIEFLMNFRSRLTSVATGDQGIFVSRMLYQRVGGYAAIPLMEDIEYSKRLRCLHKPVNSALRLTTSARRWNRYGLIKTVLLMWWLRLCFVCGVPPAQLASWYR